MPFQYHMQKHASGVEILVCKQHREESCVGCQLDFIEANRETLNTALMTRCVKPAGTELGRKLLEAGTFVRKEMEAPVSDIEGEIVGVWDQCKIQSEYQGQECYVLKQCEEMEEYRVFPVSNVHEDWMVQEKEGFVPCDNFLRRESEKSIEDS
ncbi:MAG: hypothetical protein SGCHY_002411 [Lobulomycetales sp.]